MNRLSLRLVKESSPEFEITQFKNSAQKESIKLKFDKAYNLWVHEKFKAKKFFN